MSDPVVDPSVVERRSLLRRSALVAGAAGAVAVGAAVNAPKAAAVDGQPLLIGLANDATTTTTLTIDDTTGGPDPALTLVNADGPALRLEPLPADWDGALEVGELASDASGPVVGFQFGNQTVTDSVATLTDIDFLPRPVAFAPERVLDTRTNRSRVLRTSPGAYDSAFRLKARAWLDVWLEVADANFIVDAAYLNVTATGSLAAGYLTVYPPGPLTGTSTLNYGKGQTLANSAAVATELVTISGRGSFFAVRVYASSTTHVILDLAGEVVRAGNPFSPTPPRIGQRGRGLAERFRQAREGRR
ncbi:MAG: hypothetical protein ACLGIF_08965 [Actinomycetes bacterium]